MRFLLASLLLFASVAQADEGVNLGIDLTIPSQGQRNWGALFRDEFAEPLSAHDHTGSGKGLQIGASALTANAVTGAKFRLDNNQGLRSRNAANSADVDTIKLNASDKLTFGANIAAATFDTATITAATINGGTGTFSSVDLNGGTLSGLTIDGNLLFSGTRTLLAAATGTGLGIGSSTSLGTGGASIELYDNLSGFNPGGVTLKSGNVSGAALDITNQSSNGSIEFNTAGFERWEIQSDGDLQQEVNSGGNIVFSRQLTGIRELVGTYSAAGTDLASATAIVTTVVHVTAGTGGLALPATIPVGGRIMVFNETGVSITVYANTGHTIQGVATNVVTNAQSREYVGLTSTRWFSKF